MLFHVPTNRYLRLNPRAREILGLVVAHSGPRDAVLAMAEQQGLTVDAAGVELASVLRPLESASPETQVSARRASASRVRKVVGAWLRLPPRDVLGTAVAGLTLLLAEVGLRTTDIRRVTSWFRVPLSLEGRPAAANGDIDSLTARERRRIRQVEWVLARWLYPNTCLRRSLLVGFFLRSKGPVLRLGLLDDGETAHAWVEAEGRSYWSVPGLSPFVELRS